MAILQLWQNIKKKWFYLTNSLFKVKNSSFALDHQADLFVQRLIKLLIKQRQKKILVICPKSLTRLDFFSTLKEQFVLADISIVLYDKLTTNPTITFVEQCVHKFFSSKCQSILAIGDGSTIVLAKATKARILNPDKSIYHLHGLGKVKHRQKDPLLIACPTTLSASHGNYSSYILDHTNQRKFALIDRVLLPNYVLHCTELVNKQDEKSYLGTACSALADSIEALLSKNSSLKVKRKAAKASQEIIGLLKDPALFESDTPSQLANKYDLTARLQKASYIAGCSVQRALNGYVTAMNHALTVYYGLEDKDITHITLAAFLEAYEKTIPESKLAPIENIISLKKIKDNLNFITEKWQCSQTIAQIQPSDYPLLIDYIEQQVNELYTPLYILPTDILKEVLENLSA